MFFHVFLRSSRVFDGFGVVFQGFLVAFPRVSVVSLLEVD